MHPFKAQNIFHLLKDVGSGQSTIRSEAPGAAGSTHMPSPCCLLPPLLYISSLRLETMKWEEPSVFPNQMDEPLPKLKFPEQLTSGIPPLGIPPVAAIKTNLGKTSATVRSCAQYGGK